MTLEDYKIVSYHNQPDGWVAEVPALSGCYALMPNREEALSELEKIFEMIAAEYGEKGLPLPVDNTAIVNAWRACGGVPTGGRSPRFCGATADWKS